MIVWGKEKRAGEVNKVLAAHSQSRPLRAAGRPRRGQTHCFTHGCKSGLWESAESVSYNSLIYVIVVYFDPPNSVGAENPNYPPKSTSMSGWTWKINHANDHQIRDDNRGSCRREQDRSSRVQVQQIRNTLKMNDNDSWQMYCSETTRVPPWVENKLCTLTVAKQITTRSSIPRREQAHTEITLISTYFWPFNIDLSPDSPSALTPCDLTSEQKKLKQTQNNPPKKSKIKKSLHSFPLTWCIYCIFIQAGHLIYWPNKRLARTKMKRSWSIGAR